MNSFYLTVLFVFIYSPQAFFKDKETAESSQKQFYVFQTMMGLPSEWNMEYKRTTGTVSVFLHGTSADGVCGSTFDRVKNEQEYGIVFEDEGQDQGQDEGQDQDHQDDKKDEIDIDINNNIGDSAPNFN
jgi:hypothetical protein